MTPKRSGRIFVFGLLVLLMTIEHQTGYSADNWLRVRSSNFVLAGDASENQIRRIGRNLEQFREAFAMLFPSLKNRTAAGTTVLVFRNDDSFKPYKPVFEGKPVDADAYFQAGQDVNYMALNGGANTQFLVLHEYVHVLIKDTAGSMPTWASEGLAEYYSTFDIGRNDREFTIGRPIDAHIQTLRNAPFIPLDVLFGVNHDSPYYNESAKQGVFYAQSWALVHYLNSGKNRTLLPQFSRFISLLATDKPIDESFKEAFQRDYAALEKELRDYIRQNSWPEIRLVLDGGIAVDRQMTVSRLSEAESEYYLGDLLYRMQRHGEAEAHLAKAVSLDTNLGSAHASLAMMRVQQKQYAEALTLLKRAAAGDSQNHLVHYFYADMLDRLDREDALPEEDYASKDETMRTHLMKSIELNPSFLESYVLLAQLNLLGGEQIAETETLLNKALSMAPGRQDLALLLAQTMLRTEKVEQARALLTPIARGGTDAVMRRQAEQILQNFDLFSGDRDAIREGLVRREIAGNRTDVSAPASAQAAVTQPPLPQSPQSSGRETVLEALTPVAVRPDGEHITGLLVLMDCTTGLTLRIQANDQTVDLHSDTPSNIQFLSYVPGVSSSITCGPRNPGAPVTVTYNKETREPLVVEFVEQN
jgi:tetratricopeptide (TPR) repeat protein